MEFMDFFQRAVGTGAKPYAFQQALADEGLPTALTAPTGTGKTEAAVLGHLYRRLAHPDLEVRSATPRWLVLALPTRGLVNQTVNRVLRWVANLELPVEVHTVMGGEGWDDRAWRGAPRRDAVFIGTVDMLLSRALNRGFADSRWSWPISFGLFNNGVQWVFDEVQQMELAAITGRQLQSFRNSMGTVLPTSSMWMSATLDLKLLATVDAPGVDTHIDALNFGTASAELQRRLDAPKRICELEILNPSKLEQEIAAHAMEVHQSGSLTLVVCNTVQRAQGVASYLTKLDATVPNVVLHRRLRPPDRAKATDEALAEVAPDGPGLIVVSTQVLEAGIDLDAATLITEVAPWSAVVQRAGRCNRAGLRHDSTVYWVDLAPKASAPYEDADLEDARLALRNLEGLVVTPASMGSTGPPPRPRVHHVIRRRDLLELFDTSPDLSGDSLDVSRYIRDSDERDVYLAWRHEPSADMPTPGPHELCPVSIAEITKWAKDNPRSLWRVDPRSTKAIWVRVSARDIRPGLVLIASSAEGGYRETLGWSRRSKETVKDLVSLEPANGFGSDLVIGADPASQTGSWYPLDRHLDDVDRVAADIVDTIAPFLSDNLRTACCDAAALHDLGKAHDVWQSAAARAGLAGGDGSPIPPGVVVAKTPGRGRLMFSQPYFRHELVSLVALRGHAAVLLEGMTEPDLCCYLVAAHHGRVRLSVRSVPGEVATDGSGATVMLGVVNESLLGGITTPRGLAPEGALQVAQVAAEWTRVALGLRDRSDLGPFRLGFLEAVVRLADWEASAAVSLDVSA